MLKKVSKNLSKFAWGAQIAVSKSDIDGLVSPKFGDWFEPKQAVVNIINYALFFVGAVALVFVVYGGILMVTAGGDVEKVKKGRDTLLYAILGIIVIVLAFAIINWATRTAPTF